MKRIALFFILLFAVSGCAPTLKMEQHVGAIQVKDDELPRQVAILPFTNDTKEAGVEVLVRRNFANHFSSKSYQDLKLPLIDEKLVRLEKSSGQAAKDISPKELAAALGVNGLLYGKVTDYRRIYAGVYSQLGVEAEVWLVNVKTGKEVFRFKEAVRYHEGGVPTSPLSAIVTVVSTAMNLRDIQMVRLVNELCYKFMEKIPAPATVAAEVRPVIKEVLSNAADAPFGPKRVLKVGMQGDPGLIATFDIGNFKRGIAMMEVSPGIYAGEYHVLPGDTTKDMPVTVTLAKTGGYETEWVDPSGFVTIDTTPPPAVAGVRAKGHADRVDLTWDPVQQVPDLKGYRVLRSDSPLSGYQELGTVEVTTYADATAAPGKSFYYRVVAVDEAGNESPVTDGVHGGLVSLEPVAISGELQKDTVLDGAFRVTAPVIVPKGITLTVTGESRVLFAADSSLKVAGRLAVKGADSPVQFLPDGDVKWGGIVIEGGHADLARFTVRGAQTGIASRDGELLLDGGLVTGCGTGVAISGMTAAEVKGTTISGNGTGVRLSGTAAKVVGSSILQNQDGIVAEGFSGEIRDNNILDNNRNVKVDKPLALGANWFGTVRAEALKLEGAKAEKVYDARIPGGNVVPVVVNRYAGMSPEELQKKGTELVIEAGGYFRQRNFGKAAALFDEVLQVSPAAETYYYLSLCHQEMSDPDKALTYLREGTVKFPQDAVLWKSLGMLSLEKGDQPGAKKALQEALRLSPGDRQAKFMLERLQ